MAECKTCGAYYKLSAFNKTENCEDCSDVLDEELQEYKSAYEVDLIQITNPTGKTKPVFND